MEKIKAGCYQIGDSFIASKGFVRKLGFEPVIIPPLNKEIVKKGISLSPEFSCFPFKTLLGIVISSLEKGAKIFILPEPISIGACQSADFASAQKFILKKYGYDFDIIGMSNIYPKNLYHKLKEYNKEITLRKVTKAMVIFAQKIFMIENINNFYRDIYLSYNKKKAEYFKLKWTKRIDDCDDILSLKLIDIKIKEEYNNISKNNNKNILKIAIIGDIYCLNESYLNNKIFERLYDFGIYVENGCKLSTMILPKKSISPEDIILKRKANKYLRHSVGGFSLHTIKEAIKYAEKKYDGIIHIYPFNCMPETVVRSLLPKIGNDYNIPILYLPIDEQTGDAGFATRIEAFIDLILLKKKKNMR
jgi:predicted nucleotide-binding protein (sugar kinase/HSP70/actin superfamily)